MSLAEDSPTERQVSSLKSSCYTSEKNTFLEMNWAKSFSCVWSEGSQTILSEASVCSRGGFSSSSSASSSASVLHLPKFLCQVKSGEGKQTLR